MVGALVALCYCFDESAVLMYSTRSLSAVITGLFSILFFFSLALLGLSQFGDRPTRWLKYKNLPIVFLVVGFVLYFASRLSHEGIFAPFSSWLSFANYLLNFADMIICSLGFYQLIRKYGEAAQEKMAEKVAREADPSFATEPPKKKRFRFKTAVKTAVFVVAAFAFLTITYRCAVSAFGKDPVVTVAGETYTVVKTPPEKQVTTHGIAYMKQLLEETNSQHQASWPNTLFDSPENALEYGITVLNDVIPDWTYDNRVRLIWDTNQRVWWVYGQVENQDTDQKVGSVMFDPVTGKVLRIDLLSFVYE